MNNTRTASIWKTTSIIALTICLLANGVFHGCARKAKSADSQPRKQLLVYCGITMTKPMEEIIRNFEAQEDCDIVLTKGGSGNLLRAIEHNQVGDLFLPGSESYIKTGIEKGLIADTRHVGFNKAAMMVRKGNPKNITNDLSNLADKQYYVVIGNPDSGSIGRETKKILAKAGIFDQVENNAREFTTDSKRLIQVLRDGHADLVVNWYATSTWEGNQEYVDVLPIDPEFATPKKLVLGLLNTSKHPDLAKRIMEYAASEKGRAIFNKYGLYNVK